MRVHLLLAVLVLSACPGLPETDAGTDGGLDASVDAGEARDAGAFIDGGVIEPVGGCYWYATGSKFIFSFELDGLCANVSFRRLDAGFAPKFAGQVTGPDSAYGIDDARVGLCTWPDEVGGMLNPQATPIDDLSATFDWFWQGGMPLTWGGDGTIAFLGHRYSFTTPPGRVGLSTPCLGP